MQAPGEKAAGQLAGPAADLEDRITAADPGDLTGLVDEFVGISRTAAVVLGRYLVKDLAVTTCIGFRPRVIHWPPFMPGRWPPGRRPGS